jgi:hypothetical protein
MYHNMLCKHCNKSIRTAVHPFQATFAWASATDLGQGLGAVVADLVLVEVDRLQRLIGLERLRCRSSKHLGPRM